MDARRDYAKRTPRIRQQIADIQVPGRTRLIVGSHPWEMRSGSQVADVDEVACDGGGRGHGGADKVGPAAGALAPLEIPV